MAEGNGAENDPAEGNMRGHARALVISLVLLAVMGLLWLYGWSQLPADARVPIHWGLDGEPDRYAGSAFALGMIPVIAALITLSMALLPKLDPRRSNLLRSSRAYVAIWVAMIGFLTLLQVGIVGAALGYPVDIPTIVGAGIGILFIVVGNFLGKIRSNFFLGMRTPWTLSSDRVWHKTHRVAGPVVFLFGAATVLAAFAVSPRLFAVFLLVGVLSLVVFVIVYSYVLWRQEQGGSNVPTR